ncbi:TetR/AcrR family transcriptional regulator [Amycolatopsis sp. CA-161197]|uniref:TetR/AcrR family transcriptional regulator n=1 Tax=Amycolatopsis sp. CA-161197 TaxID=3239922 RepID=UPI003D906605
MLDRDTTPERPPGLTLAWGGAPPPRRGPRPAHTVEQIVAAAVELADAEGAAGASLPNIAHEIGVTTNALYRYVSSKEELTVLLADAGWGPPPPALVASDDWRADVRAWARAVVDRLLTRPWLLDLPRSGDAITPNRLAWTELLLAALTRAGVHKGHLLGCVTMVAGFAHAAAARLASPAGPGEATAVRDHLLPHLDRLGSTHLAGLVADGQYPATQPEAEAFLQAGLDHVVAGVSGFAESH